MLRHRARHGTEEGAGETTARAGIAVTFFVLRSSLWRQGLACSQPGRLATVSGQLQAAQGG